MTGKVKVNECGHYECYFGGCYGIEKIEPNKCIPVGGNLFTEKMGKYLYIDYDNLKNLFNIDKLCETTSEYLPKKESWGKWLKEEGIDVDPEIYMIAFLFTKAYDKKFGYKRDINEVRNKREELFKNNDIVPISEILEKGIAECAEIAALAQLYFQKVKEEIGIEFESTYISGEVLWDKDREFGEPHSFIHIKYNGREYIFDPANPIESERDGTYHPRIQTVEDFKKKISQDKKIFVKTVSIYNNNEIYYGVGNRTNVTEDNLVD